MNGEGFLQIGQICTFKLHQIDPKWSNESLQVLKVTLKVYKLSINA